MDGDSDDLKPRKRMKLRSWLVFLLLPVVLVLPCFGEFMRNEIIGREVVCCMSDNREELEQKAAWARENRQASDIITQASLIVSMALAVLVGLLFLVKVVRFLPLLLKLVFMLLVGVVVAYTFMVPFRMYNWYRANTDTYYETEPWGGFREIQWYSPEQWPEIQELLPK